MHIERTKKHVKRHIMRIEDVASRVTIMENIFRLLFVHAEDRKQAATNSAAAAATAATAATATAYVYISDAHLSTVVLELLNICLKKTIRTNNERQNNQNKETKKSNTQEMNDNSTERAKRLSQFVEEGLERVNGTSKIQKIENVVKLCH